MKLSSKQYRLIADILLVIIGVILISALIFIESISLENVRLISGLELILIVLESVSRYKSETT